MINRIRDVRKEKGVTLAEVAAACDPPTTAQTIGRLETGMRNLSLDWMNRIAAALGVEPETLLKGNETVQPQIVARLTDVGAEALTTPRDAILPTQLDAGATLVCMTIDASQGEYRAGDQLWLRQMPPGGSGRWSWTSRSGWGWRKCWCASCEAPAVAGDALSQRPCAASASRLRATNVPKRGAWALG